MQGHFEVVKFGFDSDFNSSFFSKSSRDGKFSTNGEYRRNDIMSMVILRLLA